VQHYTSPFPGVAHWASLWCRLQRWHAKGTCGTPKEKEKKKEEVWVTVILSYVEFVDVCGFRQNKILVFRATDMIYLLSCRASLPVGRYYAMAVAWSCSCHSQAICHICHLLSTELAVTLACSLVLTRLDYCNSVLYGAPASSIEILQQVQNSAARIVLQAPRRSNAQLFLWAALVTHSTQNQVQGGCVDLQESQQHHSTTYLSCHIKARVSERTLRSSAVALYWTSRPRGQTSRDEPFFVLRPTVWNSLPETIIHADSLSVFKSRLKTYFVGKAFD